MADITKASDYRAILKEELDGRCQQNPRYSLRAFARDLELAPSRLSEILNRKQGLSRKGATRIAEILGFHGEERDMFCDMVVSEHARSKTEREVAKIRLAKYQNADEDVVQLQLDAFKVISDWYHMAIIDLSRLGEFKTDPRWIARKLRITPIQAELAIDRLLRLGLLERQDDRLVAKDTDLFVEGGVPSESIKKFHRQILQKATDALTLQSIDKRHFFTQFVTIDRNELAAAKKEIDKFQHRFCSNLERSKTKDSLYCMAIQFFDLLEESP